MLVKWPDVCTGIFCVSRQTITDAVQVSIPSYQFRREVTFLRDVARRQLLARDPRKRVIKGQERQQREREGGSASFAGMLIILTDYRD